MREIKFRAWHKPTKHMVQPEKLESINFETKVIGAYIEMGEKGFYKLRMSDFEIMQYTELHDDEEDQNELYESDIVEIEFEGEKYVCLIEFSAGTFLFTNDDLPDGYIPVHEFVDYDRRYGWVNGCRKLGNRWEHPNLLGGNQG